MYVGTSELYREWNELDAATLAVQKSRELGEQMGFSQNGYRWRVALARIREATGDLTGALDLLQEAEPLYMSDFSPNARPIEALKARVLLRQSRLGEALAWARERELSPADDLSYVREFEHITLARVLVASGDVSGALGLLEPSGSRGGWAAKRMCARYSGDTVARASVAGRYCSCAGRTFVDQGAPMAALLRTVPTSSRPAEYARQLLSTFAAPEDSLPARQPLAEALSERELDVLRLLATELDGPEIASQLVVSLNTMRTHTRSIYAKLGVTNRRAAVRRAEKLQLLSHMYHRQS
jgi:LuxR family transcriptional regulator, maltose regulon positive regulatory protein